MSSKSSLPPIQFTDLQMTITTEDLYLNKKWLYGEPDGVRLVRPCAVLSGADLRDADLRDAVLRGAIGLAIAEDAADRLRAVATAALASDDALDMDAWHSRGTTHCIARWAIHQAGEVGRLLEASMGAEIAGLMLLGPEAHSHFFDDNEKAREFLQSVLGGATND